jgi:diacylglycerol kinase family enzyme
LPCYSSKAKLPSTADHVVILVNPKAGPAASQTHIDRLAQLLTQQGYKVHVSTDLPAATAEANQLHAQGCLRALVGAGGDGTAAALVNGTDPGVPIALFPAGNTNLLARYYGLKKDPEAICRTICEGATIRIDAGLANGRIFLLMAGCGFDAEVVQRTHEHRTGHISKLTYFKPILDSIWSYSYSKIQVHWSDVDGGAASPPSSVRWAFAFNLPCYAGGLQITPQANGFDGLFDVCTFRPGGLLAGLWLLVMVLLRLHPRFSGGEIRRAKRLRLTSEGVTPYQLDGDPGGVLPLDIEMLPGRLTLVVPDTVC